MERIIGLVIAEVVSHGASWGAEGEVGCGLQWRCRGSTSADGGGEKKGSAGALVVVLARSTTLYVYYKGIVGDGVIMEEVGSFLVENKKPSEGPGLLQQKVPRIVRIGVASFVADLTVIEQSRADNFDIVRIIVEHPLLLILVYILIDDLIDINVIEAELIGVFVIHNRQEMVRVALCGLQQALPHLAECLNTIINLMLFITIIMLFINLICFTAFLMNKILINYKLKSEQNISNNGSSRRE